MIPRGRSSFQTRKVSLLGCCHEDGRNILVYESMMNGILKEHLHV
uniref:Uncharacterized protein n=1 Tax=Aegilops tauschii subsp. strangulata TaxID=200361 RepID=A0A453RM20_AEGTS